MKIKCPICPKEFDLVGNLNMHFDEDHKIRQDISYKYSHLLFKIHEKIESLQNEDRHGMVADYRHGYSDQADLLKSLLEDKN
jgi:hypothetical protein